MSREIENHERLNKIEFRRSSEDIKFEGFVGDYENNPTPEGKFAWLCKSCRNWNSDSTTVQPHTTFQEKWACKKCKKSTTVNFPNWNNRGLWMEFNEYVKRSRSPG